ncbi:unnamed protein product [Nesidiocoris tenuis]|uniref:Uncharacterized protein n=1 Tax=Nesidiocoris tenuis TaxID=355587 RepID=A0A6H5GYA0_9HEMI|nr:unnamed protein product [Nesidiocoris tenuis]
MSEELCKFCTGVHFPIAKTNLTIYRRSVSFSYVHRGQNLILGKNRTYEVLQAASHYACINRRKVCKRQVRGKDGEESGPQALALQGQSEASDILHHGGIYIRFQCKSLIGDGHLMTCLGPTTNNRIVYTHRYNTYAIGPMGTLSWNERRILWASNMDTRTGILTLLREPSHVNDKTIFRLFLCIGSFNSSIQVQRTASQWVYLPESIHHHSESRAGKILEDTESQLGSATIICYSFGHKIEQFSLTSYYGHGGAQYNDRTSQYTTDQHEISISLCDARKFDSS